MVVQENIFEATRITVVNIAKPTAAVAATVVGHSAP